MTFEVTGPSPLDLLHIEILMILSCVTTFKHLSIQLNKNTYSKLICMSSPHPHFSNKIDFDE